MDTTEHSKSAIRPQLKQKSNAPKKGRYASVEEASAAKMESAREFIANIDLSIFRKNGPVE